MSMLIWIRRMSWDAIAAIGELLGAAAVLVTLIYLAAQIRQNTAAVATATYGRNNEAVYRASSSLGSAAKRSVDHVPLLGRRGYD